MERATLIKFSIVGVIGACVSLGLLLCCGRGGRDVKHTPESSTMPTAPDDTPAQATKLGTGVRILKDVPYGSDPAQSYDIYLPQTAQRTPILFMVHGGAWRLGDKGADLVVTSKVRHWVPRGYAFVSTNYRLVDVDPVEQTRDVARALAQVQSQAQQWEGDAQRLVLIGHSSGAHLVALLSSDRSLSAEVGLRPWLGTVALDSAAFDVSAIMKRRHFRFYDRVFGTSEDFWRRASPLHQLSSAPPPFLAVCSSERGDSCPQAQAYVEKARQLGGEAKLLRVPKSHRDINGDLGVPGTYTDEVDGFLASVGLP